MKTKILALLGATKDTDLIGNHVRSERGKCAPWDEPIIMELYKEYLSTGAYPYLDSVVDFIIRKFELSLPIEQRDKLKTHVYLASEKHRDDKEEEHKQQMIAGGWLLLDEEIVRTAIENKKKVLLSGKIHHDWLVADIKPEPFRPIIDGHGKCFLIAPGKRSKGYYVHLLKKPFSETHTFCKVV